MLILDLFFAFIISLLVGPGILTFVGDTLNQILGPIGEIIGGLFNMSMDMAPVMMEAAMIVFR